MWEEQPISIAHWSADAVLLIELVESVVVTDSVLKLIYPNQVSMVAFSATLVASETSGCESVVTVDLSSWSNSLSPNGSY